jgi:NAD+ synthase (glutamine-hydrolysing)
LAQIDPTVGDLEGNAARVIDAMGEARRLGAHVVAFPEMVLSGYPPEDLLLKDHFLRGCERALGQVAASCHGLVAVVGVPVLEADGGVANAAAVLAEGVVQAVYHKIRLPNYAVFDEERYFTPGRRILVVQLPDVRIGVNVCEDIWWPDGPTEEAAIHGGAKLIINISMSPYHMGKGEEREEMLRGRALDAGAFVACVNGVGGQDELVFDGHSLVIGPDGKVIARGPQFGEALLTVDLDLAAARIAPRKGRAASLWDLEVVEVGVAETDPPPAGPSRAAESPAVASSVTVLLSPAECPRPLSPVAEVYAALRLGVHDYVEKNRFRRVVVGLSGGIDSALTVCIAVDALGAERVTGVTMPSRYSSIGTRSDARETAENLGIDFLELPIEAAFLAYLATLEREFAGREADSTEENLQARIRGNLLMALSNKFGWLVLATGNKSEMAVGYATLYGDMAGGFAVIKDVPKTLVYELAAYRNLLGPDAGPIPATTITRPPSAELRPDQTDQDSLPPYDVLDAIIEAYVVRDESVQEIAARGLDLRTVERVVAMIDQNEYKRRQAAPGVRITPKAFGKDRRLPITNGYRG